MKIERLTQQHVPEMVKFHADALANDLLPSLGLGFLSILHNEFVHSPYTLALGSIEDKKLHGFVVGTKNTAQFMRYAIVRNLHRILPIMILHCLTRPVFIKYLFQTLAYGKKINVPSAELLIIVVSQLSRRQGVGTKLFKRLISEFKALGIKEFIVGTHADTAASNHFYKKLGGTFSYRMHVYDNLWNYYVFKTKS